ncbi:MAG: PucR family transcriptional regulator ligand-binding domain-containing protein [Eubacteriales bacterium]|nr:PucR family transcriptional regulator ligand-binding domain-containing protein [Eubacteriales bacterium]
MMLTVMELVSFPLFRRFQLVSGYGGLYNQVTGTGIFEWESSNEVEKNFKRGEFVVTTLSLARSDAGQAEDSIRMLIDKKVSAIAVKDIYFHEISEDLKAYSDARQVPIFFFSDTFFDDIIYTIKNALLTQNRNFEHNAQIEFLLGEAHSPEQKKKKAKEINPFFHPHLICCYASAKKESQWQEEWRTLPLDPEETVYSFINYQQGLLVVYTMKDPASEKIRNHSSGVLEELLMNFLEKSGLRTGMDRIGVSRAVRGLENLGVIIQESLYAHEICQLNHTVWQKFSESGPDQILLPASDSPWTKMYYNGLFSTITEYDALHGAKLMETLLEYVKNNGNIKLTAQKLYQHGNTIRYRIGKIRTLLNLEEDFNSFAQLYLFVRLHLIYRNKEGGTP